MSKTPGNTDSSEPNMNKTLTNILGGTLFATIIILALGTLFGIAYLDIKDSQNDIPAGTHVTVHGQKGIILKGYSINMGNSHDVYDVRITSTTPMYVQEFRQDEIQIGSPPKEQ